MEGVRGEMGGWERQSSVSSCNTRGRWGVVCVNGGRVGVGEGRGGRIDIGCK